ncbi:MULTISPECIES: hypothetical protein [unclassified Anabaena]|uniref:hypothetical protein n=1 Tax=unclassified Anabaena TaxID=2619674 RepID=UPI002B207A90|nr:hypothetical protein [Anabaena sp. UHCC 0399]MEA5566721.1 hypothetical protein [Anabaena sp. UHCC 0399]
MRVWLACFLVLFALAELFDWLKGLSLPLPIYILGGAFLAVASNYEKIIGSYFSDGSEQSQIKSFAPSTDAIPLTPANQVVDAQQEEIV